MFQFLTGESMPDNNQDHVQNVISEGQKIVTEQKWDEKYPQLAAGLESSDPQEQYKNGYTAVLMRNQGQYVENALRMYGESTVVANLGSLAPRIMDVVRIFAPNTISHIIANAQPLSQMTGQVVVVKPQFTDTASGVSAGEEVFKDQTDGTYAAESQSAVVDTGDGIETSFSATLYKVRPSSLTITTLVSAATVTGVDDGNGSITGTGITSGSIDYNTGELAIEYAVAPDDTKDINVTYDANSETDAESIRELELGLNIIPVTAEAHPLRISFSVQAELAAAASIALDVEDTMSVVAGQFLKIERDRQLLEYIGALAPTVDTSLVFDAAENSGVPRRDTFKDFALTLSKAENAIFAGSGRGSVSWIACGNDASVVVRALEGFMPEPDIVPLGAHVIGRVGGMAIIKDPYMATDNFIAGYNGILPGDSGVIVADWIPMYFTPTFRSPDLVGRKGFLSMYDIVTNVSTYYKRGRIDNI